MPSLQHPTPFQASVYEALQGVPSGRVTTYGAIAHKIGSAPRAVGQALGANKNMIIIPCHRVVQNDGSIGGYAGGVDMKREILQKEGVQFEADGNVCEECIVRGL